MGCGQGGRACTCCRDSRHDAIDAALLAGASSYRVAARFGLPQRSVFRHAHAHLAVRLQESEAIRTTLSAENLLNVIAELDDHAHEVLRRSLADDDRKHILLAIRESRANVEAFARLGSVTDLERRVAALEGGDDGDPHDA